VPPASDEEPLDEGIKWEKGPMGPFSF
jgi:hypothetical protein